MDKKKTESIEDICHLRLSALYGENVEQCVLEQLDWELKILKKRGLASNLLGKKELIEGWGLRPYEVSYQGALGSSLVAFLCGITCVNPLESKLPLYPEFLFGIDGDKEVTFELNVPSETLRRYGFDTITNPQIDILYQLIKRTGVNPEDISLEDKEVGNLLGGNLQSEKKVTTLGIPEFENKYVRDVAQKFGLETFVDLVQLISLLRGTINLQFIDGELLRLSGITKNNIPATREDVYEFLKNLGFEKRDAFRITEYVRKGKVRPGDEKWEIYKKQICEAGAPNWITWFCERVSYLVPRAQAYIRALQVWWIAWFKLHYPKDFYATYFDVHGRTHLKQILVKGKEAFEIYRIGFNDAISGISGGLDDARDLCGDILLAEEMFENGIYI